MNIEQIEEWYEKYDSYENDATNPKFKTCKNKFNPCKDISSIMFLASKLKDEYKSDPSFLHGEYEKVFIGSSFDIFEDFTEEDVKTAVAHGIYIDEDDGGFYIYASM